MKNLDRKIFELFRPLEPGQKEAVLLTAEIIVTGQTTAQTERELLRLVRESADPSALRVALEIIEAYTTGAGMDECVQVGHAP